MSSGTKCSRSTPLDGDAFLTSAITPALPAAIVVRSAPAKPRGASPGSVRRLSASARRLGRSRRLRAAFTSSALTARIFCRMSDMLILGCALARANRVMRVFLLCAVRGAATTTSRTAPGFYDLDLGPVLLRRPHELVELLACTA